MRRWGAWAAWWILPALAAGCGEGSPPPIPQLERLENPILVLGLEVIHHQGELPVAVGRTIRLPLASGSGRPSLERVVEATLTALVAGPNEGELRDGITSFFSDQTQDIVRSVTLEEGTAIVDFEDFRSRIPNASSSAGSGLLLQQLDGTLFRITGVEAVEYRIEGSCDRFWNFLQRSCAVVPRPEDG